MTSPTAISRISMVTTGSVRVRPDHVAATWKPMMLWMLTSRSWTEPRPNVFVIEHKGGVVLFATGQDRASITDPDYFPTGITGAMYRRTAQPDIPEDQTLTGQLARLGYQPSDVSVIVRQPGTAPLALVGDLTYALDLLDCGHVPGSGSRKQLQQTTNMVNELRRSLGGLVVLATHDPEAERQLAKALER